MAIEIEAKFRVVSHEPVRARLRALGAIFLGRVIESNRILDRPDGSLRRAGRGLRVRFLCSEEGVDQGATLTFKGPRRGGPFKSREELETVVDSADTVVAILNALGFVSILSYQKRRESWSYGACRIELDGPPHIGLFVEIEGPDEAAVRAAQSALGLDGTEHLPMSYVGLLWEYCLANGITDRVLDWPGENPTSQ